MSTSMNQLLTGAKRIRLKLLGKAKEFCPCPPWPPRSNQNNFRCDKISYKPRKSQFETHLQIHVDGTLARISRPLYQFGDDPLSGQFSEILPSARSPAPSTLSLTIGWSKYTTHRWLLSSSVMHPHTYQTRDGAGNRQVGHLKPNHNR